MSRLPDFVIVGAVRSGSTALYRYLADHPSISMPDNKEVRFFNRRYDRGLDWYTQQFVGATDDQTVGEATPGYMNDSETIDRMAATIPDARLIAILRDPVDRIYSHYWMDKTQGRGEPTFEKYLDERSVPFDCGRYAEKLENVCRRYPREQLLVLFYEDLRAHPHDVYRRACRFIGVDDGITSPSVGQRVNQYVEFRSLRARNWSKRLPGSLRVVDRAIGRLNTRTGVSYPPMKPETRRQLAEYYSGPNADLEAWLGRGLPPWTGTTHQERPSGSSD